MSRERASPKSRRGAGRFKTVWPFSAKLSCTTVIFVRSPAATPRRRSERSWRVVAGWRSRRRAR